jgi:hypothetical protein
MAKYLEQVAATGRKREVAAEAVGGSGAASGKIPQLDGNGRIPATMMPAGITADTEVIVASEALAAGDFVNVHNSGGSRVRKADATTVGKEAHGFVLSAVANAGNATVYFEGANDQVTGQTPGPVFLATSPGQSVSAPPSATGNVQQSLGVAVSATKINFERGDVTELV